MLGFLAFLAQDYVLRDPHVSAVAAYGPFRIEREDRVERQPSVAVLHYAPCLAKARLIWSSADGRVGAEYDDDGGMLTRMYRFPLRHNPEEACYPAPVYTAYRDRPPMAADWRAAAKPFGATLARCSPFAAADVAAYEREFAAAADRYEAAARGLRALAATMFHTLRRCTELRYSPRWGGPGATARCVREEGPPDAPPPRR